MPPVFPVAWKDSRGLSAVARSAKVEAAEEHSRGWSEAEPTVYQAEKRNREAVTESPVPKRVGCEINRSFMHNSQLKREKFCRGSLVGFLSPLRGSGIILCFPVGSAALHPRLCSFAATRLSFASCFPVGSAALHPRLCSSAASAALFRFLLSRGFRCAPPTAMFLRRFHLRATRYGGQAAAIFCL